MELNLKIDIKVVEGFDSDSTIARVFYPNEGNRIEILKGLSKAVVTEALFHEIGHIIDWYLSNGCQSGDKEIREKTANIIQDEMINALLLCESKRTL